MEHKPVDSSNIESVAYDPGTQTMEVKFRNGSVHQYDGVPADKHAKMMKSQSVGSFFHVHIRGGKFKSRKVN